MICRRRTRRGCSEVNLGLGFGLTDTVPVYLLTRGDRETGVDVHLYIAEELSELSEPSEPSPLLSEPRALCNDLCASLPRVPRGGNFHDHVSLSDSDGPGPSSVCTVHCGSWVSPSRPQKQAQGADLDLPTTQWRITILNYGRHRSQ